MRIPSAVRAAIGGGLCAALLVALPASTSAAPRPRTVDGAVPRQAATCAQPYAVGLHQDHLLYGVWTPPDPPLSLTPASVRWVPELTRPPLDSEGNGTVDTITESADLHTVTIHRTSGDLVLTGGTDRISVTGGLGRLDGTVHDAIGVVLAPDQNFAPPSAAFVVPGQTANGTYAPATVGIQVPTGWLGPVPFPDQQGHTDLVDASDYVSEHHGSNGALAPYFGGTTRVLPGPTVMALGAGGDARSVTPVIQVSGTANAFTTFNGADPLTVVALDGVAPSGSSLSTDLTVRLATQASVTSFAAGSVAVVSHDVLLTASTSSQGRYLRLDTDGGRGGDLHRWWWSVDRPCGPFLSATTPTTAPPTTPSNAATPVVATPTFTG